jgi:hypothetical protein
VISLTLTLREKVRQLQAEERRIASFGTASSERFVPFIPPRGSSTTGSPPGNHLAKVPQTKMAELTPK